MGRTRFNGYNRKNEERSSARSDKSRKQTREVIKVVSKLEKSRFDYTILQLYFHQLIKKNLQYKLEYTYNNPVKETEFSSGFCYDIDLKNPSIGDLLQIFSIVYNIGHFYNTFVASRAITMLANENSIFYNLVCGSSQDVRYKSAVEKIFHEENYHWFHLINSLLVLERCSQEKFSVKLAKELIYAYLNQSEITEAKKLNYVFRIFQSVRSVAYVAYDLQIARVPLTIDLSDDKAVILFFSELLSEYNNKSSMRQLVGSISKMLDDTVYNEKANAICYYNISKKIVSAVNDIRDFGENNYYDDFWLFQDSIFNRKYSQNLTYCKEGILKITFDHSERQISKKLLFALDHMDNTRVGYYDRHHGERTILVSIKKDCKYKTKVAFRIFKTVISHLREIKNIESFDVRYLLSTKFFLFYFCGERPIILKPIIDEKICVLCTRGKNLRINAIRKLLNSGNGNTDQRHEVDHLIYCLSNDVSNDTTLSIPGSIIVYDNTRPDQKLCEFDGMIIFPMRRQNQIILLESKNSKESAGANKCLCKKLDKLGVSYIKGEMLQHNKDVYMVKTVGLD